MVDDMVNKEEKILFPMSVDTLSDEEWAQIRAGEDEIGYALIGDVPSWPAEAAAAAGGAAAGTTGRHAGRRGRALADHRRPHPRAARPDAYARCPSTSPSSTRTTEVRFYSEGERVFPRSPGVIGRKVQNCHPPKSVHKVEQIVDAFHAGEKDVAEFWIEIGRQVPAHPLLRDARTRTAPTEAPSRWCRT